MTDKSVPARNGRTSAFAVTRKNEDQHIIDELIEERCPSFVNHWTWPVLRAPLLGMLGYNTAVPWADHIQSLSGADAFDYLAGELELTLDLTRMDRIPKTGPCVVIANHPTGLADGVAVWDALTRVRRDVMFFANADAVRISQSFSDVIIPVEWVLAKRTPAKTRETLRLAGQAFAEEKCIMIFPSGKLAKMIGGHLTEQEWFSTAVGLARKKKAPIVPLHVEAKNSSLYYFLSRINGELRDITLFKELVNKRRTRFAMTAGPLIQPDELNGDVNELTEQLRQYVAYDLGGDPDRAFAPS